MIASEPLQQATLLPSEFEPQSNCHKDYNILIIRNSKSTSFLLSLCCFPELSNIKHMNLSNNFLNCKNMQMLCKMDMNKLENLILYGNNIGNQGVRVLTLFSHWSSLRSVDFGSNYIANFEDLEKANWPQLCSFMLYDNPKLQLAAIFTIHPRLGCRQYPSINIHKRGNASLILPLPTLKDMNIAFTNKF